MARVFLTRLAEEQLSALPPKEQVAVSRKLFILTEFPRAGVRLREEWVGCRALYSEYHRIVYHIPQEDEVEVLYIRPSMLR